MDTVIRCDQLNVITLANRSLLGKVAAKDATDKIKELLNSKDTINIIFAAAPSQSEFLHALRLDRNISWNRINAFHMDEYLGLPVDAEQNFGQFLNRAIFSHVPFRSVNYINGNPESIPAECERYGNLILRNLPDIVFMGIGENTHIAFNEPGQAEFNDPHMVKAVTLDEVCRQQQVNDKCFARIDQVPRRALTLTIPSILQASSIFCMVPGKNKAKAVSLTLTEQITEEYPSTILRNHPSTTLYLDSDSAALLNESNV